LAILTSRTQRSSWQLFGLSAGLVAIASVTFVIWTARRLGGDQVTIAVDDIGEAVAALVAAVSCAFAAGRAVGRLRLAWSLLSAAAASWCAGEILWSIYEVGLQRDVPFPSAADVGFLAAIPLTVVGILSFSHTPRGTAVGVRLWLDRAIVFIALAFVGWELGLNSVFQQSADTAIDGAIALAYPLGDIAIATVLLLAIRRATDEQKGRLFLLLGGLAANAAADSAFAYLTAAGAYGAIGSVLDAGWVIGYLLVALAALWPSGARDRTAEEKPIDIWQLALPWLAILAAGLAALVQAVRGHPLDTYGTVTIGVLAILLMVSQVLAHNESLSLLIKSRVAAATLNEVIAYAPLGVVRIGHDLRFIQANPSFAALMRTTVGQLEGAPVSRFFPSSEIARASNRFREISGHVGVIADFDTQAIRGDGTTTWVHWTASTVRKATGEVDYYLVMFEDISARRAAEEVAAANLDVLARLNKVKSQFLTKVSHEFRTALVGIQGFSEYIRESDTLETDDVKAFANDIYDDARRLDRTLSEMLELDRSEAGRGELHITEVDLGGLIKEAIASVQTGTSEHAIQAELQEMPKVIADRELVSQVVTGLLGRALDYSPSGAPILVTARANGAEVQVGVTDHGRASAPDLEAQLLGHATAPDARNQVGVIASNVGLPMARQIVEMHGGRVWFELGAATVWSFSLPVSKAPALSQAGS
jgi:two-component system, sensor histidine kinase and response regulator